MEATSKETIDAGKDENGAFSNRGYPPLFLEGPARHMKVVKDEAAHRQIYEKVRAISLFVMKLPMYLICESLADVSGARLHEGFSAELVGDPVGLVANGLEGYMEVLRAGLYEEFFEDIKTGLVPFRDPKCGRSLLEALSFIVSSAFPDQKPPWHGFCARLTSSTVEFQSMWTIMVTGGRAFTVNDKSELVLRDAQGRSAASEGVGSFRRRSQQRQQLRSMKAPIGLRATQRTGAFRSSGGR